MEGLMTGVSSRIDEGQPQAKREPQCGALRCRVLRESGVTHTSEEVCVLS